MAQRNANSSSKANNAEFNPVVVCDYGCGPGKWIKKLDHAFSKWEDHEYSIIGLDISQNLVNMARKKLSTARVAQANLEMLKEVKQALEPESEPVSFGVCANVLIAPSVSSRNKILTSIRETMRDGGIVVFVVPALESSLYCEWRWLHTGPKIRKNSDQIPHNTGSDAEKSLSGSIPRDGVRTTHWIREEVEQPLPMHGFRIIQCDKAEYGWGKKFLPIIPDIIDTFDRPLTLISVFHIVYFRLNILGMEFAEGTIPDHMNTPGPGPWDWVVVAEKLA
jgi:SAM-dependent methyltransferase